MAADPAPEPAPRRGYHHGNLREALLAATRALVAERGPQGFTLTEAARRAGVSASAPYRHFRDRDEVLAELCRRGFAVFGQRLQAAIGGAATPAEALAGLGPAYLAFAREEPGYYAAMFAFRPSEAVPALGPQGGPRGGPRGGPQDDPFDGLARAVAGVLPAHVADPPLVALQIWALSHGVAMLERVGMPTPGNGAPPPERILDTGVAALLGNR